MRPVGFSQYIVFEIFLTLFTLIYSGSSSTGSGGSADSTEIDDMLFALYTELQKEDCMVEKIRERFADIGINITLEEVGINQSKQLIWQANFELVVETKFIIEIVAYIV